MSTASGLGKVFLVGAGPGDPGLLTLRAAEVLRGADVLLYDALASDAVVALAVSSCERIFVGKRGGDHAMPQKDIESLMIREARTGKRVVRLKGGDPFVFGRGGEEAQRLREAGVAFEVVLGISSAIAAPAYAGIPVTHRDFNTAFTVATGHEDPTKALSTLDWSKLADPHRTLILLMAIANLPEIAQHLIAHGLDAATPVAVVQDGTRPTQRTAVGTLATIAQEVAHAGIGAPAVAIVGEVVRLRELIRWFDTGPLFGKRVLITRPEHQAEAFAQALYARGAMPLFAPAIVIGPPDDALAAQRAIERLSSYAWVVFTSQNGVDAFFERLGSGGGDARALAGVKVAVIGSKTAERLRRYGVRADLMPATFVAEELARPLIEASQSDDSMLIFRAQEARDVLPRMLAQAGRAPTVVAGYKTTFADDPGFAQRVADADVLTFTSASTVRGFSALLGSDAAAAEAARAKVVACIGPITTEAARAAGFHVEVVAAEFTTDGLLEAIASYFAQRS